MWQVATLRWKKHILYLVSVTCLSGKGDSEPLQYHMLYAKQRLMGKKYKITPLKRKSES